MIKILHIVLFMVLTMTTAISSERGDDSSELMEYWTEAEGRRFDIMHGYLKSTISELMYDESAPLPGGVFATYFSFNIVDFQGNELGCGLYCDNQWGGNPDEQYYFIPFKYEVLGDNLFRLSRDHSRKVITNKNAPVEWVENSENLKLLVKELCNEKGWIIDIEENSFLGTVKWILSRADSPETKQLYFNSLEKYK